MKIITLFLLLMIAQLGQLYSQILQDSSICIDLHQAKTINLTFAKLDYMIEKDQINKDLLRIKSGQVDNLRQVVDMRQNQLMSANSTIGELERKIKSQNRQLLLYKIGLIGSSLLLLVSLI